MKRPQGHPAAAAPVARRPGRRVVAPGRAAVPAGHWIELGSLTPRGAPERPVRAYVPGVPTPEGRPLLVLFDGQNVFGDEGSYAGGWHAHTAVDGMTAKTVVRPIVVAVHHGGVHRNRELGHDVRWTLDAVVHDLMPTVEARFRLAGPRVIGGASLGGLAALHACLERPGVFDGGLIMSPSLWYARHALLHAVVRGRLTVPPDLRLYVDAGGRERGRMFADAELLTRLLAERGLPEDRLMWRPDARGAHHERAWRRRLPKALRFLFRAPI